MAPRAGKQGSGARRGRRSKTTGTGARKQSRHLEGVKRIELDDYDLLRKFLTEHGKIIPSRISGVSAAQQRRIRHGICRARVLGIFP